MSKNHRKMIFTAIVGITTQIIWSYLFPKLYYTDYFSFYTITLNLGVLFLIIVQIVSAQLKFFPHLLSVLLAIVFSPLVWFFIGFQFQIPFLYETLCFGYTPFGLSATLLSCQLIENFSNPNGVNKDTSPTTSCSHCGTPLSSEQLFCNNCFTMSHKVKDVFIKFPQKHHLDFAEIENKGHRHCPHCDKITITTYGIIPNMGIPVRVCNSCHNVYISTLYCEWSMASITNKILMCIFDGPHIMLYILLPFGILDQSLPIHIGLISLAIVIALRIIWFFTITVFAVRESEARLTANPEYPKILADMGYAHFSPQYKNLTRERN